MTEIIVRDSTDLAEHKPLSMEEGEMAHAVYFRLAELDTKRRDDWTEGDHESLTRAHSLFQRAFAPAGQAMALVALRYLKKFKARRNTDTNEYAVVLEALARDLSKWPLWAVQLGCERYRVKADKTFFPDSAEEIISLARPELRRWRNAKDIANRLKTSMEWEAPERLAELKEEMGDGSDRSWS